MARADCSLGRLLETLARAGVLVVDDFAMAPLARAGTAGFPRDLRRSLQPPVHHPDLPGCRLPNGTRRSAIRRSPTGLNARLFTQSIEALASRANLTMPMVGAQALAHEIGHVLLRDSAHAASGSMAGSWAGHEYRRMRDGYWCFRRCSRPECGRRSSEAVLGAHRGGSTAATCARSRPGLVRRACTYACALAYEYHHAAC